MCGESVRSKRDARFGDDVRHKALLGLDGGTGGLAGGTVGAPFMGGFGGDATDDDDDDMMDSDDDASRGCPH